MSSQKVNREIDEVISYAVIFADRASSAVALREEMRAYQIPYQTLSYQVEQEKIPKNSIILLQNFQALSAADQRVKMLDDNKSCQEFLRVLFGIIQTVKSDAKLQLWCLAVLNGILEDHRGRLANYDRIQNSFNKCDIIGILYDYIEGQTVTKKVQQAELAAHTLSIIIQGHEKWGVKDAEDSVKFLRWLLNSENEAIVGNTVKSACIALLCKNNMLAEVFVRDLQGVDLLQKWLQESCGSQSQKDQLAYNALVVLWIISYHDYALTYFGDYDRALVEQIAKVLDYYNKEKIIRITCMLIEVSSQTCILI